MIEDRANMETDKKSSLQRLKEQRDKINARIQAAEARGKTQERKIDTRRKILIGSYYLDQAKQKNQWEEIKQLMDAYLTRPSDRKLFELG